MFLFILGLLFALAGLVTVIAGVTVAQSKGWTIAGGFAGGIIGLAMILGSMATSVPVKSVGVITSYGKVEGIITPGFHMLAPWRSVNILPETIQTNTFEGVQRGNSCGIGNEALNVRIGGQQAACLDVTIQWQVEDSAAPRLFNDYDTSSQSVLSNIQDAVVTRELRVAVNQVMGDYNPIADVSQNGAAGNSQFSTFGPKILTVMRKDIGGEINVRNVLIQFLHFDANTQSRLNSIQQQYGNTAVAQQEIKTNQALAAANNAIKASVTNNPGVLVAECLSLVQAAEKDNYALPAGFSCFGTNNGTITLK